MTTATIAMPLERFACMTHAVDVLVEKFGGLSRKQATFIVWDLDMGTIGADRGIWIDMSKAEQLANVFTAI